MMNKDKDTSFTGAGGISAESVANIRTIASYGLEKRMTTMFNNALGDGSKAANRCVLAIAACSAGALTTLCTVPLQHVHHVLFVLYSYSNAFVFILHIVVVVRW